MICSTEYYLLSKIIFKQKIRVYGILFLFLLFKTLHDIDEILLWLPLKHQSITISLVTEEFLKI